MESKDGSVDVIEVIGSSVFSGIDIGIDSPGWVLVRGALAVSITGETKVNATFFGGTDAGTDVAVVGISAVEVEDDREAVDT